MFADNSFDLVQMRNFASVLKADQWISTLRELKRVCRPGGMIQLLEVDYKVCKEWMEWFASNSCSRLIPEYA